MRTCSVGVTALGEVAGGGVRGKDSVLPRAFSCLQDVFCCFKNVLCVPIPGVRDVAVVALVLFTRGGRWIVTAFPFPCLLG